MFSTAYANVSKYTRPVVISKRLENGMVNAGVATFILLNKDGWALTAAHVMVEAVIAQRHAQERAEYQAKMKEIENNSLLSPGKKRHEVNQLRQNREWITNISYWWGLDGVMGSTGFIDEARDIAAVQLTGAEKLGINVYPTFAGVADQISPGTSLCRLGFPFHAVNVTFDSATQGFRMDNMPPLSMFPNEGIHTRIMIAVDQNQRQTKFLETSSAGLRGQSGGPIFDSASRIWAVQSKTLSIPLGFAPTVKQGKKEFVEHQFIHIGVGCHVEEIRGFLSANKIPFNATS